MLTEGQIAQFVSKQYPKHLFYQASVDKAEAIGVHSEGKYSEKLMNIVRPNEEDKFKDYRKVIFESPTLKMFGKVINSLAKIEKAEGWSIDWPEPMPSVPDKQGFEYYMTKAYPGWDSFNSFYWNYLFPFSFKDPNAVFAIHPKSLDIASNAYFQPIVTVFSSDRVIDFKDNQLAVLLSLDKSPLKFGNETKLEGKIFYLYDTDSFCIATQVGDPSKEEYELSRIVRVPFGYMPAFKAGSFSVDIYQYGQTLYDSIVKSCLPDWNEAVRAYSDHQVNKNKAVHARRWELAIDPCKVCEGKGTLDRKDKTGKVTHKDACKTCGGSGRVTSQNMFGTMLIKPNQKTGPSESLQMPLPPFGSEKVETNNLQFIKDEVKDKIYEGLQALNMEDLMERPSTASNPESGLAKMIDRSDKESFVFNVARFVVDQHQKPFFYFHAVWMFGYQFSEQVIEEQILPKINIPTKFDVVTTQMISERLVAAKNADMSGSVKRDLEKNFIKVEFGDQSYEYIFAELVYSLNPLPGKDIADITMAQSAGFCTKQDAVIAMNIEQFVTRALKEDEQFAQKTYAQQKAVINSYAQEILKQAAKEIVPLPTEEIPQ